MRPANINPINLIKYVNLISIFKRNDSAREKCEPQAIKFNILSVYTKSVYLDNV